MKPSKLKVNVLTILLFAVVAVVVLVLFEYRQITTDSRQQILISPVEQMRLKMRQESEPIAKLDPAAQLGDSKNGRNMGEYYSHRQYPGSPPIIPHEVNDELQKGNSCLSCHASGEYVAKWKAFAPISPHPDYVSCRQCHLSKKSNGLFMANNWTSVDIPPLGVAELIGSPPPIPHDTQMRSNCISCHAAKASSDKIKVEHFARMNCRQCHVPSSTVKDVFSRNLEAEVKK